VTIAIDLAQLTDERIEEALQGDRALCDYTAPCIIGTLMTPSERRRAQQVFIGGEDSMIDCLVEKGIVSFPNKRQVSAAQELQRRFDSGVPADEVRAYARKLRERFAK
jgi:hypothetical protein